MENTAARHQVIETRHGYAVKDTRRNEVCSKTYKSIGWAIRKAERLNEQTQNLRYA